MKKIDDKKSHATVPLSHGTDTLYESLVMAPIYSIDSLSWHRYTLLTLSHGIGAFCWSLVMAHADALYCMVFGHGTGKSIEI